MSIIYSICFTDIEQYGEFIGLLVLSLNFTETKERWNAIVLNIARMIMEPRGPHVMSSLGIISINELIIKAHYHPRYKARNAVTNFKKMHICYIPVLELKELINIST